MLNTPTTSNGANNLNSNMNTVTTDVKTLVKDALTVLSAAAGAAVYYQRRRSQPRV